MPTNPSTTHQRLITPLALFTVALALVVVLLGAYTRLRDAGLGCPDWPGCYGQLQVPQTAQQLQTATRLYPQQPVESTKAWAEMIHRYMAGTLGLLIFSLAVVTWRYRRETAVPHFIPLFLIGLLVFQALLGKWTVTLLLYPPVVMGHLLAGLSLLACLWWVALSWSGYFRRSEISERNSLYEKRYWALAGLFLLIFQIALGGWTSANYAGPACPDFPFCQGQLIPAMHISKGFDLFVPVGANFQGGLLETAARVAIHVFHRFGALIVCLYFSGLSGWIWLKTQDRQLRYLVIVLVSILLFQIALGILLVLTQFPLWIAVAHNGAAALLLLTVVTLNYRLFLYEHKQ